MCRVLVFVLLACGIASEAFAPAHTGPSVLRPARRCGRSGPVPTPSIVRGQNDAGDFMARLLHKYVLEGSRKDVLKVEVKTMYPFLPDAVMEWSLNQVADLISESGPSELEAFLPGAPASKRCVLRDEYAVALAARGDIPFVPEEVEAKWCADFIDKIFTALLETDQQKLTEAYLNAKLRETSDQ
mmetsp:Transcript_45639/g.73600  ORF Transcript_45639/g.73600 Transcript_45639/m.73600 type:complete len:185 (+) Transcript_45639:30-584(+)